MCEACVVCAMYSLTGVGGRPHESPQDAGELVLGRCGGPALEVSLPERFGEGDRPSIVAGLAEVCEERSSSW